MARMLALTERSIVHRWEEVKSQEALWEEINEETGLLVKRLLESAMEEELLSNLVAGWYKRTRSRQGYRNGYYNRSLLTRYGIVELRVPRARRAEKGSQVLERYKRREKDVDRVLRDAFLAGISTRRVGEALEPLLGTKVSASTVSRVTKSLDEEVRRFHWRRLADHYQYLMFDGICLKVKHVGGVSKRLVLTAYGITTEGKRELIDFKIGTAESQEQWESFLEELYRRGVEGKDLELIVTDGCPGLHAALEIVYPRARKQRCWAHKLRNVVARVPKKHQKDCMQQASLIYNAENTREAGKEFQKWAQKWRPLVPKAVECLEKDMQEMLAFTECPREHWKKVRTTNAIERSFREVRRRTRPMSCFQNRQSCERIIYAVITHLNRSWQNTPLPHFTHNT